MLVRLFVQNIALISRMDIEFQPGLTIITGETGAGKSIIIDSINLALGERADRDLIRHGEASARVEAMFDVSSCPAVIAAVSELGAEPDDGHIIISREITSSGKSVCRVNGAMITQAALKSVTERLVDVHGQHEHQSLLAPRLHISFLDAYGHDRIEPIKLRVSNAYHAYHSVKNEMSAGFTSEAERERRIEILTYQLNEISAAGLRNGEDEELTREKELLANGEHIMSSLFSAYELVYGGEPSALSSLAAGMRCIEDIAHLSDDYAELKRRVDEAYYNLEDIAYSIREQKEAFSFEPQRLAQVEERLDAINTLKHKYGGGIAAILEFAENAETELARLAAAATRSTELDALLQEHRDEYLEAAKQLTQIRKEAAASFSKAVMAELSELGLSKAKMEVSIEREAVEIASPEGIDKVEFMLSANAGEPLKPLVKVASGGEVSRIMLALKAVLSGCEDIPVMIFDEIDTGISGSTASVVGQKLRKISEGRQVIAITHLPQIAAYGDSHFLVEKTEANGAVSTSLRLLTDDEHRAELARIMGGADSLSALKHAGELIHNAMETTCGD